MEQIPQQQKQQNTIEKPKTTSGAKSPNYVEIDLIALGRLFLSYWVALVLALVIGAGLGCIYQKAFVGRSYQADAAIFIANTDSVITISDMQLSSALTIDYQKIITSRTTYKRVIDELELDLDYVKLGKLIQVSADKDSHVINMAVTTDSPTLSLQIANALLNTGIDRIQNVIPGSEATIVDASTSDAVREVTPSILKYAAIGGFLALFLGMLILAVLYLGDTSLKMEDDVTEALGYPVLAGVPYYGTSINFYKDRLDYYQKEAFNTLCGNIMLSGYGIKTIAITSSAPNEGKSSLAYKIAETMTEHGKKVAYVDCDMRNSSFYKATGKSRKDTPGLSQYLSSDISIGSILSGADENSNLYLILPGKNPPSASALLSSQKFKNLVSALRENFDYVIFDTPPVNLVIDAVFVASECDGAMLVVESAVTDKKQADRALKELSGGGARIMGIIINKLYKDKRKYGYGYGYGYGKKYGYGYGKKYGYGYGRNYGYGYGVAPNPENSNEKKHTAK